MNLVEQALKIAIMAHEGQKDQFDLPSIIHPISVGFAGETEEEITVGVLYNIFEKTEVSSAFLMAAGFPPYIVEAIQILTHDEHEDEIQYLHRIRESKNMLAIRVKITELTQSIKRYKLRKDKKLEMESKLHLDILTTWLPQRFTCKNCFLYSGRKGGKVHCLAYLRKGIPQDLLDGAEHLVPRVDQDDSDHVCFIPSPQPVVV